MQSYQERVFDIIDSFSIFDGSVLDCAKGIYVDSGISNMYPSNTAICCINIANELMNDEPIKEKWSEILVIFHKSAFRKKKPTYGRKMLLNIKINSEKIRGYVDIEKHKYITEVIFSGSKIGS